MTREEVYDSEISPLMGKIIELCQAHDIPILASFDLDDDRDAEERPGLCCTTAIIPPNASLGMKKACQVIKNGGHDFAAFMVRTGE